MGYSSPLLAVAAPNVRARYSQRVPALHHSLEKMFCLLVETLEGRAPAPELESVADSADFLWLVDRLRAELVDAWISSPTGFDPEEARRLIHSLEQTRITVENRVPAPHPHLYAIPAGP